jgi:RNA-splicing ligase RtcB
MEISGKYATAKVFTDNIEEEAVKQIASICNLEAFEGSTIRIMPDVHAGQNCVIGFTATLKNKVIPDLIGVDIGCGVLGANLGKTKIKFDKLDKFIHHELSEKRNIPENEFRFDQQFMSLFKALCKKIETTPKQQLGEIGSLGGGNHFIEISKDSKQNIWIIIHSGSRNFGACVAKFHQNKVHNLQKEGRTKVYLEGNDKDEYIHDMGIAMQIASQNRLEILKQIMQFIKADEPIEIIETVHNYINPLDSIMRKGAISAYLGERVVIPLNMRDGCILAVGKGNADWNYSAPHGAGRKYSRSSAKDRITLEEFQKSMKGIFSSSVKESTLDEAPFAYKNKKSILQNITETVDVIDFLIPLYNYKGS